MARRKRHSSVSEMVRAVSDTYEFADSLDQHLSERRIIKELTILRASRGLSQADVARKLACSQSRISKLEASKDADLSLGDLMGYAHAVGSCVTVELKPKREAADGQAKPLKRRTIVGAG